MIIFDVNTIVQGDIYLRCYHIRDDKQDWRAKKNRKFMFRVSFHTGFVPSSSVLRLTKTEIDDAIKSSKYDKDFFVDFLFEPVQEQVQNNMNSSSIASAPSASRASTALMQFDDDMFRDNADNFGIQQAQQQQQQKSMQHQDALAANEWI